MRSLSLRNVLLVAALAWPGQLGAQAQLPPLLEMRVPKPPVVASAEGQSMLVYELHLTNFEPRAMTLTQIDVTAASGAHLLALRDSALQRSVSRPGMTRGSSADSARTRLEGGTRAVVFLWVPVERGSPPAVLLHRLTLERDGADAAVPVDGPEVPVAAELPPIGPPLRGGRWLTANGPAHETGHRRALIPIGGVPRIAQRFAIDYVQVGDDFRTFTGDRLQNGSYHAYGAEALAVAAGTVVATKDSIPENVPGPTSRAVPITLETVGGNHVIIDIGRGRFAFYAHLQPGSLRVRVGDRVGAGDVIGLVGNSGNSTEPHLHFHIADGTAPLGSEGIPYGTDFEIVGRCRAFTDGCAGTAPVARRNELPMANLLLRFPQ